jgi:hypothetical protein
MNGYPDGCTQTTHDAAYNRDDNAFRKAAEELAQADWDEGGPLSHDFLLEHAHEYILGLCGSPQARAETRRQVERDCVDYVAATVDDEAISAWMAQGDDE